MLASDAIVEGTITKLTTGPDSGHLILKIRSVVAGSVTAPELEIHRFSDWTCAQRWAPYAPGQEALYFLRKDLKGEWKIMSAGGEGEMPIVDGDVFTQYRELALLERAKYSVQGGTYSGHKVSAAELISAVKMARRCFTAKVSADRWKVDSVHFVCAEDERAPLTAKLFSALAKD